MKKLIIGVFLLSVLPGASVAGPAGPDACMAKSAWASILNPGLQKFTVKERFEVGKAGVTAVTFDKFAGQFPKLYLFAVALDRKCVNYIISAGSYETTTRMAREMKEIKTDERLYHIDLYKTGSHATLYIGKEKPSYGQTRALVIKHITGQAKKPLSNTILPAKP